MIDVTIRPLRVEDANISYKWRNDPEVFRFTSNTYNHEITLDMELQWIKRVIATPSDYRCAILADGRYVGNVYLTDINDTEANYHIFIGNKDYMHKGVARKASELILKEGFSHFGLKRINLKVHKKNEAGYRLYKKLGFKEMKKESDFTCMSLAVDKN